MAPTPRVSTFAWINWPPNSGISVTPVREALFELRSEGLLAQQPRRGFVVLPVTERDLADVANLQAHVGGELAARAAANIDDDQLRRTEENPVPTGRGVRGQRH